MVYVEINFDGLIRKGKVIMGYVIRNYVGF